ncbi:hypothetical protein RJ035_002331 [Blastomyces gilchristii]
MKLCLSAHSSGGGLGANLSVITTIYLLLAIVAFTIALPITQQSDSISTVQLPTVREQRSLPGSLATAPEGAVGDPPSPVYGSEGHDTEPMPTKKPVYFTLLAISVFRIRYGVKGKGSLAWKRDGLFMGSLDGVICCVEGKHKQWIFCRRHKGHVFRYANDKAEIFRVKEAVFTTIGGQGHVS